MKLHDLRPAPGSHKKKTRVGRGIAAGQGKTAGRGTKGQKARAGGSIPAWFEGGQTPLHQRIPKLRGFKNPFKIEYEVVNVGAIARLVELGVLEDGEMPGTKKAKAAAPAPITVNQEILRAAGLVRTLNKPMKVLGNGELSTALFVVADAVSGSARAKIEAAGGTVSLLEVPKSPLAALGVVPDEVEAVEDAPATVPAPEASSAEPMTETPKRSRTRSVSPAPAGEPAAAVDDAPEAMADEVPVDDAPEAGTEPVADAPAEPAAPGAAGGADADVAAPITDGDDRADA